MTESIHLIGFGSQGRAWANALRSEGWNVSLFLHTEGRSWNEALRQGFQPEKLETLARKALQPQLERLVIAWLCPDSKIPVLYDQLFASNPNPLLFIFAHGYTFLSGDLVLKNQHDRLLFAPKAIGPEMQQAIVQAQASSHATHHDLRAAVCASPESADFLKKLALAFRFRTQNLIQTSFEKEALGDLISEQGLLCGGVFTLLEWTWEQMEKAQIPPELIRAECLTELELIARMLKNHGPRKTFDLISGAAQVGTLAMRKQLMESSAKTAFDAQINTLLNGEFYEKMRNPSSQIEVQEYSKSLARFDTAPNQDSQQ